VSGRRHAELTSQVVFWCLVSAVWNPAMLMELG
jgi:hypothetical protein